MFDRKGFELQRLPVYVSSLSPQKWFLICFPVINLVILGSICDRSVQIFSSLKEKMSDGRQMSVYNDFIQVYLTGINITGRF